MKFLFSCILYLLVFKLNIQAQIGFNFYRLHTDNGLAQNSVWEVFQDYKGYLWIGTADGINRWDGVNMVHYKHDPENPHSIAGNTGFTFFEDSKNQLWIFHNRGVSLYNRTFDRFQSVISSHLYHSCLGQIGNKIWVRNTDDIIFQIDIHRYNITFNQLDEKYDDNLGPISEHLKGIQLGDYFIYQPSIMVISIYNPIQRISRCFTSANRFGKISKVTDTSCIAFAADSAFVFTLNKNTNHLNIERFSCKIMKDKIPICATLHNNELWVGGEFGIYILNPKNFQVRKHIRSINPAVSKNEFIYGFYTDKAKNFYILTNVAGLYVISPSRNRFVHYKTPWPEFNMVKSIVKTPDGKLITGQYRSSLAIYNPDGTIRTKQFFKRENENSVLGLKNMDDCHVLAVTPTRFIKYNHCKDKIEKMLRFADDNQTVYPHISQYKNFYEVNVMNKFISFILKINQNFQVDTLAVFPQEIVTTYYRINDRKILIGTYHELFLYDINTGKRSKPILKSLIKSILHTSLNYFVIATTDGVYILNEQLKLVLHLGVHNVLPDNFIYGVLEDKNGNYWLSHNRGLSFYDLSSQKFIHYEVLDGLQSNEFNTGAFYKDDHGSLYFGGVNGVNEIIPEKIFKNSLPPQIAIHQILVDDEPFNGDTAANEMSVLNLTFKRNTFSVDFASLDFSIPEKNQYAYFLQGIDKDWIYSGSRHFLRYANLPPGHYTLFLKASNADGVWSSPRILKIIVHPPFWQKAWFYFLEGFLFIAIIISIILFIRRNQKLKYQRELAIRQQIERERIRISRDLHDHVGAQLSYLISQLDHLAESPLEYTDSALWKEKISLLSEAGRNAMHTLRETIWSISHQELTLEEFMDRFKQYVIKMVSLKSDIQVFFHEEICCQVKLTPSKALHMFRISQEAVHNAMKYSNAHQLDVYFILTQNLLFTIKIIDNGIGFNVHNSFKVGSYGLQNMKERAKEAGADLRIDSVIGQGTSVSVAVKVESEIMHM